LKDVGGKTISYSTIGASTHGIVTAFIKQYQLAAKPVATGSPSSTLTQVMSGQVDVGRSALPFGLDQLDQGPIRIIATGDDASAFKGQTSDAQTLQARKSAIEHYMQAYRETVDWTYSDPAALRVYADWLNITEEKARRTRDGF
jgi:NitT/TauT family transport system substrate-binding protein